MMFKVTMKERGRDGVVRTITHTASCPSLKDVIKFYGLNKPDIVEYKIEKV